jgi:imidazolonepropionase-like amidohydrolase
MTVTATAPWAPVKDQEEVVFENANVVSSDDSTVTKASLHLKGGIVAGIFPADSPNISKTRSIDLEGKYVCPGLIDCHVHLTAAPGSETMLELYAAHPDTIAYRTAWNAKQMLLRGFTTVRDTGGATYALRDAIAQNIIADPRIFIVGKALSQTGGHGDLGAPYEDASFKYCGGHGLT